MIPIAKERGLRVLADAFPDDEELVRGFGADVVLPRGDALVAALRDAVPDGVDAVFDTALLTRRMFPAIREGGAIAVVRGWEGDDVEDGIRIERVLVGTVLERTDWLREVRDLAVRGVLVPRVADTYPAEQAADAQRRMEAGGLRGRAVIVFRERRRTTARTTTETWRSEARGRATYASTAGSRNDRGQMPCLPGERIPFGSTASLIVSTNRMYARSPKLYCSDARSMKSRWARYSPYPCSRTRSRAAGSCRTRAVPRPRSSCRR